MYKHSGMHVHVYTQTEEQFSTVALLETRMNVHRVFLLNNSMPDTRTFPHGSMGVMVGITVSMCLVLSATPLGGHTVILHYHMYIAVIISCVACTHTHKCAGTTGHTCAMLMQVHIRTWAHNTCTVHRTHQHTLSSHSGSISAIKGKIQGTIKGY